MEEKQLEDKFKKLAEEKGWCSYCLKGRVGIFNMIVFGIYDDNKRSAAQNHYYTDGAINKIRPIEQILERLEEHIAVNKNLD